MTIAAAVADILAPHGPAVHAARSFSAGDTSVHFFLQLAVILTACRLFGWLGTRLLGQPQVVGEMIAGVALGPSVLGWLLPGVQQAMFPAETRGVLYAGAQLGVGLYMFLVGLSLRTGAVRAHARSAAAVSLAGIAVPFAAAALIAPRLVAVPGLFAPGITPAGATLFLGACMALTAFPMLARIVRERGLEGSAVGTLSLVAGAIDDVGSWCVLAIVLSAFGGGPAVALLAIGGGLAYAAVLAVVGRCALAPLGRAVERAGTMGEGVLAITLALFCMSAFLMDAIGIHAVFGGFALGVAMPRGRFADEFARRVEPVTVVLLLPMFFTYSGLNTRLDTIASPGLIGIALMILAASIIAKGGACYAAARLTGQDRPTALSIGALMNARGLMELIIVDIGLRKGIIGPPLFAILVAMAIVTTMTAGPLFALAQRRAARPAG